MAYSLDKLNAMLTTPELQIHARRIMVEYQDAIDKMMGETLLDDVKDMMNRVNPNDFDEVESLAGEETAKRMAKYGEEFFNIEMERLLDSYNDEVYDVTEFNIRCEILSALKDSLVNFEF